MMNSESNLRLWHTWWSVILALPIAIVSFTAIFIAHEDSLGLKRIALPESLKIVETRETSPLPELRGVFQREDGTQYLGTKHGLLMRTGSNIVPVAELSGIEIRDLTPTPFGLFAATKTGVWMDSAQGWRRVLAGDAWSVMVISNEAVAVTVKDRGLVVSYDRGTNWQPHRAANDILASYAALAPQPATTLHKLVMDLHTGQAFFGKAYEWLWIDIIGGTMLLLTFSGLIVWARSRRRRLKISLATHADAQSPAHAR